MNRILFKHIDNSSLVVFRMFLGALIFFESFGAIATGWIKRTMIDPKFTFNFIGFEWLQPLPGQWMYGYYAVMGIFGLMIMVGYKYRLSMLSFTLLWAGTYFMQKSSYNNHYYFLMILSAVMVVMPAHRYASLDVKLNPQLKRLSMPNWCRLFFFIQLFILYSYASIAKMYPDWIDLTVPELLMKAKQHYYVVGDLLQHKAVHYFVAYGGILFDGLVIPLLLWKRTRKLAFIASIIFHMFNSIIFQVGIFPYLSLAFAVFFFEPKTIQKLFLKKKPFYKDNAVRVPKYGTVFAALYIIYFIIQVGLPLRHHAFGDDVLWTEEGHRLSWRMMLRTRNANTTFNVVNSDNNAVIPIKLADYLSPKQIRQVSTKPDFMWQFAQHLKSEFAKQGIGIKVYVRSYLSVNGKRRKRFIDPEVDIANEEWYHFKHHHWILPSNAE
ncbi:HTTM domain-containing protein [Psychroserpens sp.]|uniref:HTTM domain-containing protein n=1 Tax=Psychroserpens sp. TaxID=2020870 RepID=UPI001B120561|nr:HTTM domain-containing protein [Psychroserpens sp.]MBO6607733.1 HTTM domain-containing protein [Psychroserpens sp.]MBO6630224.1 HTTM domain-containing protein [Psychroserpens sp.]MBO6654724.1 HTTM domain-containing protein [Psychroserpens sp.]MBO6682852.1 HTTM domain-containing protein [Psychroserpens sp.]MBO6751091.1 HTTM domain-containing protein [Psychroserpens sp.]